MSINSIRARYYTRYEFTKYYFRFFTVTEYSLKKALVFSKLSYGGYREFIKNDRDIYYIKEFRHPYDFDKSDLKVYYEYYGILK